MQDFRTGDKVRYTGGTSELKGIEGVLSYVSTHVATVEVTKGNSHYQLGMTCYPDRENVELLTAESGAVDHPAHYGGDTTYEVIKVAEAWGLDKDAYLFNVVKYVARAGKKDAAKELEDLKKGLFYYQRRIKQLEESSLKSS